MLKDTPEFNRPVNCQPSYQAAALSAGLLARQFIYLYSQYIIGSNKANIGKNACENAENLIFSISNQNYDLHF